MSKKAFGQIEEGLNEALAVARGEAGSFRLHVPSEICIEAIWDGEAKVWVATSENLPGLVAEAETIEKLEDTLSRMIADLLGGDGPGEIVVRIRAECSKTLRLAG
ncbi:hypothetical protein GGD81_004519 [Rhodobium orientis]|uniref:DUF1902 domain-containing protein n=1 Tax=Rhodobium orientis TaxID=34017 RepID=A0A327JKX1_9HYPH|nr:DUF1902 domain-containing protein [Rhodobium orientis]MBB4305442.1 hypothetical protein [Rhodobium orientis]MBK5948351.1 hypothetical protein [Rhodobium orientis]RAI25482.1 hypothetical protein CH339_17850 [Rhodobium orientis]